MTHLTQISHVEIWRLLIAYNLKLALTEPYKGHASYRLVKMSKCPNVELLYGDVEMSRCRNVQMLSYYIEMSSFGCRNVEMSKCRNVEMSKCRDVEMLRCRDVERGQECWPRTLTDLLQAHENGGQSSQNGEKGLNSIS